MTTQINKNQMTTLVTTKRHSMESKGLGAGYETGAFSRTLESANFDRLVEASYKVLCKTELIWYHRKLLRCNQSLQSLF